MSVNTLQSRLIHASKTYRGWINTSGTLLQGEIGLELCQDSIRLEVSNSIQSNWAICIPNAGNSKLEVYTSSSEWFGSLTSDRIPTDNITSNVIEIPFNGGEWDFSGVENIFGGENETDVIYSASGIEFIVADADYTQDITYAGTPILIVEGEENSEAPEGLTATYTHFNLPNYKMKIGDGNLRYEQLPYFGGYSSVSNSAIGGGSGSTYAGKVYEGYLSASDASHVDLINTTVAGTTLHTGDIFIVKAPINGIVGESHSTLEDLIADTGVKWQYTAYFYDSTVVENFKWRALDGNYDAKSVYFDSDLYATVDFGKYQTPESGNYTITAKGLSLDQVLRTALADEILTNLATLPKVTVSGSKYVPVNSAEQQVSITLTRTDGSYVYGYQSGNTVVTAGTGGSFGTMQYSTDQGTTWNTTNTTSFNVGTGTASSRSSKNIQIKVAFSGAGVPVSNMGNPVTAEQIADQDITASGTYVYFYEPVIARYESTSLTLDQVNTEMLNNMHDLKLDTYSAKNQYDLALPKVANSTGLTWRSAVIMIPSSYNKSITSLKTQDGLPYTVRETALTYNGVEYKAYLVSNVDPTEAKLFINN